MEQKNHLNQHADYYPWGMPARPYPPYGGGGGEMPGRTGNPNDYRHGYQGTFAERDAETMFTNFELRQYDARLARWMSTDPYYQYHSPYIAMGNNPVSGVDPDGGFLEGILTKTVTTILQQGSVKWLTKTITQTTTTLTTFGAIATGVVMTASKVLENTTSAGAGSGLPDGTGSADFRDKTISIVEGDETIDGYTYQYKPGDPDHKLKEDGSDLSSGVKPEKFRSTEDIFDRKMYDKAKEEYGSNFILIRTSDTKFLFYDAETGTINRRSTTGKKKSEKRLGSETTYDYYVIEGLNFSH